MATSLICVGSEFYNFGPVVRICRFLVSVTFVPNSIISHRRFDFVGFCLKTLKTEPKVRFYIRIAFFTVVISIYSDIFLRG